MVSVIRLLQFYYRQVREEREENLIFFLATLAVFAVNLLLFKQKGCPRNGQPVFSGMKNYAFHLAQGDISIRIMRMAMVIGTIGKAEVYFMGVILGQRHGFVNGVFRW
ncbi:MAG: hypothetical protein JNK32_09610 [Anaerolineales bacterium]|nr:hypothetical protein [Anaerolineales bacterium]